MEVAKSAFQTPLTINQVIDSIHRKKYLLPAIQREFVWNNEQIVKLFDSLMQEYPIGSFLFWGVEKSKIKEFQFYEFVRKFHERDNTHNPKANVRGDKQLTAILDGQQRLTALYIGLKGTYSYKVPWKRWDSDDAFPTRKLYLNLLSKSSEFDSYYDFRFLTAEEAKDLNDKTFWYEVGKVLDFSNLNDVNKYLKSNKLSSNDFAEETLTRLYETVKKNGVINYYYETSQKLDKVLNIFIRVNSGGTILSYSDLLLSIATAQWTSKDAREEINDFVDEINDVKEGFDFDKDFVLKSCLVLTDISDIAFKVDNFRSSNMRKIEDAWEDIKEAIKLSVGLVASWGYNYNTLTANNALIPISYYLFKRGNPRNFVLSSKFQADREKISKWLKLSLIKRAFSGQPDNVLRPLRRMIKESTQFPFKAIASHFSGTNKSMTFAKEDIESLLFSKYNEPHTFSVLSMLYPTLDYRNRFHLDHIFPKSFFKRSVLRKKGIPESKHEFYTDNCDYIGNLQLLEGLPNEEKSNMDFETWLKRTYQNKNERRDFMRKNLIPLHLDLGFDNFEEFLEEREKLISQKLKTALA